MNSLDQAVESIRAKPSDVARADAVAELQGIVRDCEAAIRVWQNCIQTTNGAENHWTIVSWLGPERVQQLHEIDVSTRTHLRRLTDLAGASVPGDREEVIIETAFQQPQAGQAGPDAARVAIDRMNQRIAQVRALLHRFRTLSTVIKAPEKKAPKKPTSRKRRRTRRAKAKKVKNTKNDRKTRTGSKGGTRKVVKKKK